MLLHLAAALLVLGAHLLHGLLHLRLLLRCQNPKDLLAELTRRAAYPLRAGGMRLGVLIEQALDLFVLLIREIHAVE